MCSLENTDSPQEDIDHDRFRPSFKYFKKKKPPPDLSKVVDFLKSEISEVQRVTTVEPLIPPITGLHQWDNWKVFCHKDIEGFYYISNPFLPGYQEYWIQRCIHDFPCKPNLCNLDAHMELKEGDNIWEISHSEGNSTSSSKSKTLMDRLRWVTLGYHYNWDTKQYSADLRSPFPADLAYLSRYVVEVLGLSKNFKAEAAIINYYHMDSTLAAHTDHSEFDLEAPLISFSFGHSAILLVGGTSKSVEPIPMFLHSGDIIVMSGMSRLAYHAVPRILPSLQYSWQQASNPEMKSYGGKEDMNTLSNLASGEDRTKTRSEKEAASGRATEDYKLYVDLLQLKTIISGELPNETDNQLKLFSDINKYIMFSIQHVNYETFVRYLQNKRINMNVRQVLKCGQTFDDTDTSQKA